MFLCAIFSNSFAQGNKAENLFSKGRFYEASINYEALIFYNESPEKHNYFRYKKALCYKNLHNYHKAMDELEGLFFNNEHDTLRIYVAYEQAFCTFMTGNAMNALWIIDDYLHSTNDTANPQVFMPLKILCYNQLNEWEKAQDAFEELILSTFSDAGEQESYVEQVSLLYSNIPKLKSPKKAGNLSRFIPGSGQVYAGNAGEGLVNFLINLSLLGFSAHQFYHAYYITGYLAGLGMLHRMWRGGIVRAETIAVNNNERKEAAFMFETNNLIIEIVE
jgi:tetratricopeptide (TPR) repeat protein